MTISKVIRRRLLKKRLRGACYDITLHVEHITNRSDAGIEKSK